MQKKPNFCLTIILFLFILLSAQGPAMADDLKSNLNSGSDLPTNITANNMVYDAAKQQVVFEGTVKVRRPDFDLDSNKLTIYFKKSKTQPAENAASNASPTDDPLSTMGTGDIDKLIAEGKVVMLRDGRKGVCNKITYYVDKELIVMEGDPVLTEKQNSVSGRIINFYVKENRSEVIGGENMPVKVKFSSPASEGK